MTQQPPASAADARNPGTAARVLFYGGVLVMLFSLALTLLMRFAVPAPADDPGAYRVQTAIAAVGLLVRLAMLLTAVWIVRGTRPARRIVASALVLLGTGLNAALPTIDTRLVIAFRNVGGTHAPYGFPGYAVIEAIDVLVLAAAMASVLCAWLVVRNRGALGYVAVVIGVAIWAVIAFVLGYGFNFAWLRTNWVGATVSSVGPAILAPLWGVALLVLVHAGERRGRGPARSTGRSGPARPGTR